MARQKRGVKLVDIARDAGVANSVVSSLFSGNYYGNSKGAVVGIGEETKKRIWQTCRKLGYRPADPILQMEIYPEEADVVFLLNKHSGGLHNNFYSMVLDGLGEETEQHNVKLTLGRFENDIDYLDRPSELPPVVQNNPTGKYVLAGLPNYSLILTLIRSQAKIIYVSRHIDVAGVVSLAPDYYSAAKLAVSRLIDLGHRRIVIFAAEHFRHQGYSTKEMVRGCAEVMGKIGVPFKHENLIHTGQGPERTFEIMKTVFNVPNPPTAAFCFDDFTATIILKNAMMLGIKVPTELSLIGCNDEKICQSLEPSLSTVRLPMHAIGRAAYDRVTKSAVEGIPSSAELDIFPVELINRDSTASPKAE